MEKTKKNVTDLDRIIAGNIIAIIGTDYGAQKNLAKDAKINPITLNRILKLKQSAGRASVQAIALALKIPEQALYQSKMQSASLQSETPSISDAVRLLAAYAAAPQAIKDAVDSALAHVDFDADSVLAAHTSQVQSSPKPKRS